MSKYSISQLVSVKIKSVNLLTDEFVYTEFTGRIESIDATELTNFYLIKPINLIKDDCGFFKFNNMNLKEIDPFFVREDEVEHVEPATLLLGLL